MADLWAYFRNLFRQAEDSSPSQPLIHELIERSEEEQADYEYWKNTLVRRRLQGWLNDQYAIYRVRPGEIDEALDFLHTSSTKGFVIYFYKTRYSERDIRHFFDFLRDQVLALGYRAQLSDVRTYNRPGWVETVERHYLKPRPAFMSEDFNVSVGYSQPGGPGSKFDQRYGNITIELHRRDERPHYLKFHATAYRDHLFTDAEDFRDLMQMILV